jgi:hypothetical protein
VTGDPGPSGRPDELDPDDATATPPGPRRPSRRQVVAGRAATAVAGAGLRQMLHRHGDDNAAGGASRTRAAPTRPSGWEGAKTGDGGAFIRDEQAWAPAGSLGSPVWTA